MAVVAAGVHHSGVDRAEAFTEGTVFGRDILHHAQRVDVEPEDDCGAFSAAEDAHDSREASLYVLKKFRIGTLFFRPDVVFLQIFVRRQAHA